MSEYNDYQPGRGDMPRPPRHSYTPPMNQYAPQRPDGQSTTRIIMPQSGGKRQPAKKLSGLMIFVIVCGIIAVASLALAAWYIYQGSAREEKAPVPTAESTPAELKSAQEIPVAQEVPAEEPAAQVNPKRGKHTSVFKEGENVLVGSFKYDGAKYGFTITMDYSEATGRFSNVTYEAHGHGGVSSLSTAVISSDGTVLSISGSASGTHTVIDVAARPGSTVFTGTMVRGDHEGSCTLSLQ